MYSKFTYVWLNFMVNVGRYTIHGCYGFGLVADFFDILDISRAKSASMRIDHLFHGAISVY